jgi:hypothetical protein
LTFSAYKRLATARDIDQDLVKTMGQTIGQRLWIDVANDIVRAAGAAKRVAEDI